MTLPVTGVCTWAGGQPLKQLTLLMTTALLAVSLISPLYPREQVLQHLPTALFLVFLYADSRRNWLSKPSIACMTLFFWLHILGARYIYSYVPYDEWSQRLAGVSLSTALGWQRNHYDRLVHLLFGVLFIIPTAEIGGKYARMTARWSLVFGVLCVLAISAVYEIFEWLLTVVMSPRQADAYNGQQGDLWDAQKDMALAWLGAVVSGACLWAKTMLFAERQR
ncbi:MAG: DUF2238 domain-containing protein [Planctomycetaceae bacterium]|nr:DUF2238 domain-containing protein [Planctomycetaceae bacterium]